MLEDRLTTKVEIKKDRPFRDDDGGFGTIPSTIASVWAGIYPLSGSERDRYAMISAEIDTLIFIRSRQDVDSSCRIVRGNREWVVRSVVRPANKKRHMEILATETRPKNVN